MIYSAETAEILRGDSHRKESTTERRVASLIGLAGSMDTADHSQMVGRYAKLIAVELGLSKELIERVQLAGVLHDIGKIGVADAIVNKAGPLDPEEWNEIKKHPEFGARMLERAELWDIADWVVAHHERPDGKGYPLGLTGDEVPLEARIVAVADAYEAMTTDRVYRAEHRPHGRPRGATTRGGHPVRRSRGRSVPEGARAQPGSHLADRQRSRRRGLTVAASTNESRPTTRRSTVTGTNETAWRPGGLASSANCAGVSGSAVWRSPRPSRTTSPACGTGTVRVKLDPALMRRVTRGALERRTRSVTGGSRVPGTGEAAVVAGCSSSLRLRWRCDRRYERRQPEHQGEQEQYASDLHNLNLDYRFMDARPIKFGTRKHR